MKKILILDYTLAFLYSDLEKYPGGAAVEWFHWIQGFNANKARVGVLTFTNTSKIITKNLNFDLIETWDKDFVIPKIKLFYPIFISLFIAAFRYKPDYIVQETARKETGLLAIISKILRKKFIYRVASDYDTDDRINNYLPKYYVKLFYLGLKWSDLILCQNEYQLKNLKLKFPHKKVILLNTPFSLRINKTINEKRYRSYFAWIGTFRSVKNIPALLKIVKKLPNIQFKIAGGKIIKNFTDSETENAVKELQKLENVEFMKYMNYEDIPKFLEKAYALINTSKLEGFSNTFLESFAVGTPIISTKNVNPNNIISNYDLGIVAETYEDIPKAIEQMVNISSEEYNEFSKRCISYINKKHEASTLAVKFLDLAENL